MGLVLMFDKLGWEKIKIGNVVNSISENHTYSDKPVVLINTSDVLDGKVLNHKRVKNENLKGQFKKSFKKNDILFSEIRPINGRNAIINFKPENYIASTKLMVLRPKYDNLNVRYFYYFLTSKSSLDYLQALAESRSGTFPQITFSTLSEIEIYLPKLDEQKKIANLLSSFDDKIENNNAIIANLEEQTQTIFKSWFIDFEPFNEEDMYESELGKIPAGWSIGKVGDVSNLFDSQRKPLSKMKRDRMDKNYPYYGANGIIDYVDDYLFDGKYLLLGEDGTVQTDEGYPILNYINEKFWVSNHAHIMTGDKVSTEFLYVSLKRRNIRDIITGAVQQKINQANLKSIKLILPTKEILNSFQRIVEPMFEQKLLLKKSNNKLAEIRDTLLPKLMSGEIRIGDVTKVE